MMVGAVGRWQGMLRRPDRDALSRNALDQSYSRFLSYFNNPVGESPLTYHCGICGLIDENSASGAKKLALQ